MPLPRKQKPRRKPFVITFAQVATVALLPGCIETTVTSNPPPTEAPSCPPEQPLQGEACSGDLTCDYEFNVGCGPQPAKATCKDDVWVVDAGIPCNPPIPPDNPPDTCQALATEAECSAAEDCRWLVPGCEPPLLPQAGCFAKVDCVGVTCGDDKTCQEAVIDPCYNLACDACGMTVSVCLSPSP
ncbi:hypothetical protein [Polyangium sorediatum]|uniref:Uncharacterized protein n=1 Tax=Polyangium sorediatum TaxID=889274 RepID=A0ABT6P1Z6_9BACT|nr:hypothetical protein [Polyangium sorediatum]MDI1434574.1 hypothetical protein [Polyangium sorediatum]